MGESSDQSSDDQLEKGSIPKEEIGASGGSTREESVSEQIRSSDGGNSDDLSAEEVSSHYMDILLKPSKVWKIILLATLSIIFIASIFLNVSLVRTSQNVLGGGLNGTAWILISVFGVISVVSLSVSFWMYYIRALLLKDGPALVPERWGLVLSSLTKMTYQTNVQTNSMLERVVEESLSQSEKSESLLKSFLVLQEALDSRDREIERLKKGYDAKIFKRFLSRFIRVDRALVEIASETKNPEDAKNLIYLNRLMEDALDECGVERYTPELGADYRSIGNAVADEPKVVATEDAENDFKISAVESEGYVIRGEGEVEVIVSAKVAIYRFDQDSVQKGDQ